jgi:hypothetical protein
MLERELKDPALFERTRVASWGRLNPAAHLDIAQVWFDCGDADTARKWLDSVPQGDNFRGEERDELLIRVAAAQGDAATRDAAAWRRFRRDRSRAALDVLLNVIGADQRDMAIEQERRQILGSVSLEVSDALFLLEMGFSDDAEIFLLERIAQISGDHYGETLDLAEAAVQHGLALVATLLYRALLESILVNVRRTAYRHAAKYLAIQSRLARSVADWRGHPSHEVFVADLRKRHGLKKAFWAMVD